MAVANMVPFFDVLWGRVGCVAFELRHGDNGAGTFRTKSGNGCSVYGSDSRYVFCVNESF